MSIATGGFGRRNRYTQAWLDSSPSYPDSAIRESAQEENSDGLAARLYNQCRDALRDLCSQERGKQVEKEQSVLLKEELAKLYLWGQNFGHGELDAALGYSDDTLCAALHALANLGRALLQGSSYHYLPGVRPPHNDQRAQELQDLIEQARAVTCGMDDEQEEGGSDGSSGSDESDVSDEEEDRDIPLKIKAQIRHLVDLGPTVQQNHQYAQRSRVESTFPPIVPFHLSDPAKIYASLIREKYKKAQDQLIDRLGECNWQRHRTIRETTETLHDDRQEEPTLEAEVHPATKGIEGPCSVFRPYSAFHDSGLGTSIPAQTHYAQSHNSFQSSNSESSQGSLRVPPTPAEVGTGKAFQCPICGSTLTNLRNRIEWKMHVFADLQPYICTFAGCDKELAKFSTRAEWAEHEFTEHRVTFSWNCSECSKCCDSEVEWERHLAQSHNRKFLGSQYHIAKDMACVTRAKPAENEECPLCLVVLGKPRRELVKHVGRHMEEIALIVLPRENDEDSEASSASGTMSSSLSFDAGHGGSDLPAPTGIVESEPDHDRGSYGSENRRAFNSADLALVDEPAITTIDDDDRKKPRCPDPNCRRLVKDLKAHMLTHQSERPEKCLIKTCEYHQKGFARKYDLTRHTLTHYKGNMVCDFCPGSGSALEKSFNRSDVFKRHLTSVHGVVQTPPNSRKKNPFASAAKKTPTQATHYDGRCSTCYQRFRNAQEFYEHLDDCVLRTIQQEEQSKVTNERESYEKSRDEDVEKIIPRHNIFDNIPHLAASNLKNQVDAVFLNMPSKTIIRAVPDVRDHCTDQLNGDRDEYIPREIDEAGERKISPAGELLGGRQFSVRTFCVPSRGEKRFMLATECARVLGYRDSYLLLNKNRSLYKIIATQQEKDDLIARDVLPYTYRTRQIAIVTAKSMFRQFGSRVIEGGRRVRDDYWEAKAVKQGFTEEDLAGDKRPGAAKARDAAAAAEEANQAQWEHQQDGSSIFSWPIKRLDNEPTALSS